MRGFASFAITFVQGVTDVLEIKASEMLVAPRISDVRMLWSAIVCLGLL